MNERQKEAAERALHRVEMNELMKSAALKRRNQCIKDVSFFGLPYRILFSLDQPPLSRFYPFRACSAETEARVNEALKEARERQGELSDEEIQEIRERLEAIDYTPEADRERLFTCFLEGWDFQNFRLWDWTGNKIPSAEADRLRQYYTERQKMYMENPEKYAVPALIKDDDMGRYSPERQELLTLLDDLPDD